MVSNKSITTATIYYKYIKKYLEAKVSIHALLIYIYFGFHQEKVSEYRVLGVETAFSGLLSQNDNRIKLYVEKIKTTKKSLNLGL